MLFRSLIIYHSFVFTKDIILLKDENYDKLSEYIKFDFIGSDCAIIMYSCKSRASYEAAIDYSFRLKQTVGFIPTVVYGNMTNEAECAIAEYDKLILLNTVNLSLYFDINVMTNNNLNKPFLILVRKLTGKPDLGFIK